MGIFEFDVEAEYSTTTMNGWIFSFSQEFGLRGWDGPKSSPALPGVGLPSNVYRFGWDFELATPNNTGPWSAQIGFNPSINSDLDSNLSSEAWNYDSHGMLYYRTSPTFAYAMGAGFWDRVNDRVIPYAGVVWAPDNRWLFHLVFPQPRVSYYFGKNGKYAKTFYVSSEYHVEAYDVDLEPAGGRQRIETSDWRVLFGLKFDTCCMSTIVEAGWVFDRQVQFGDDTVPDFDIETGFIARAGFQF